MPKAPVTGTELYYITEGAGFPLLIMHGGLGIDHGALYPWFNSLGDTFEVVYYDHRGNGRSGRTPRETRTHARLADDAAELADHLGHEKVAVLGFSYGGFIALEFALRHPERLSHLILLDTAPVFNYGDEILAIVRERGTPDDIIAALEAEPESDEDFREKFSIFFSLYFKNYDEEIGRAMLNKAIFTIDGGAAEGELENYNMIPRLGEIETPTLVVCGRYDFVCPPAKSEIMHAGLPNSELVIFEESGHFPFVEEEDAFFETVKDWFRRTA